MQIFRSLLTLPSLEYLWLILVDQVTHGLGQLQEALNELGPPRLKAIKIYGVGRGLVCLWKSSENQWGLKMSGDVFGREGKDLLQRLGRQLSVA